MLGIGDRIPEFNLVGVKPGFTNPENDAKESAFVDVTHESFEGKWKCIFFYPLDFTTL